MLNNMGLTKREKVALVIFWVIGITFIIAPEKFIDDLEVFYLYCFAFPFLLYVVTDPERIKRRDE